MELQNIKAFRRYFNLQLSEIYPQTEIDTFFFYLIEEYLGLQRIDYSLQPNFEIPENKQILFNTAIERLLKEEPIQYILGKTEFYGLPFKVTTDTLIPRPETEELVEWILKDTIENANMLDIGTGTGCIPISLKKHLPKATVSAIDISYKALEVAKQNAKINNTSIQFIESDILKINNLPNTFDVIVSNPPYVRNLEKTEIKNNVLNNEPHLALFVEDKNPLIFYKKIADLATKHLKKGGFLFFEINQYLGKETVEMLAIKGFKHIELKKDLFGNDRMIKASLI
ncbi:peptide chain release factor N(5)-glutamine methyltransferase [Tenacibaculum sp. 190524A02b]|uniref:peptide chain release factor N(5)-glutamine methyltransferase n=1 Tax=Tenacibaculum vairaonense TaxID=3137860 RepID=UPI0031FA845F